MMKLKQIRVLLSCMHPDLPQPIGSWTNNYMGRVRYLLFKTLESIGADCTPIS